MQVIVLLSQKGGSGKTTLAGHIGVQAERRGAGPVALLDADPQESLADWWLTREAAAPTCAQTSLWRLEEDLRKLEDQGIRLAVVDTPPGINPTVRGAVELADHVVVPVKPSPHDLRAVARTVTLVEDIGKPMVFVVNCASSWARITPNTAIALSQHGSVAPAVIHQRADFATSMIDGRTVMEIKRRSRSADEIAELWDHLASRLGKERRTSLAPLREVAYA